MVKLVGGERERERGGKFQEIKNSKFQNKIK